MADGGEVGRFDELEPEDAYPGVTRRAFSGEKSTVTSYAFKPGASFPRHHHPQEQVTLVTGGTVEMTIDGEPTSISEGGWSVVPGGVEHGITAGPGGATIVAMIVPRREASNEYELTEDRA